MISIWSSSKGPRPQIRGPQCPVPKFQPGASWGRGTKAGRQPARSAEGFGGSSRLTSWLLSGRAAHPRVGAPGAALAQGSGFGAGSRFCSVSPRVPPHRVRLPGGNVDGAGAGPQAPPPSGGLIGGPCCRKGVRRPVPGAPPRPAAGTMLLLLLYFSSLHFVPKFHSPHPQCPAP